MLRIKQIKSYKLPRYPQGLYYKPPDCHPWKITGSITSVAMLALVLSSCKSVPPGGVVGPPPMPPDMVTEREARTIIEQVFSRNGIELEADVPFTFSIGAQDPIDLSLDGYNKDLNVGYEYKYGYDDYESFTIEVTAELGKASGPDGNGPYIKIIDEEIAHEEAAVNLENTIQDFIDDLRSRGII